MLLTDNRAKTESQQITLRKNDDVTITDLMHHDVLFYQRR